jgi:hypothetical protein
MEYTDFQRKLIHQFIGSMHVTIGDEGHTYRVCIHRLTVDLESSLYDDRLIVHLSFVMRDYYVKYLMVPCVVYFVLHTFSYMLFLDRHYLLYPWTGMGASSYFRCWVLRIPWRLCSRSKKSTCLMLGSDTVCRYSSPYHRQLEFKNQLRVYLLFFTLLPCELYCGKWLLII